MLFHKADLLIANDLDTLLANSWARKFKKNCGLIYDSHEVYCETPELINRPRVQRFWKRIEQKYLPKVDQMYTVNDSIAQLYRNEYNKEVKVVRNISDAIQPELTKSRADLGLPEDKKIVLIQGAGINIERGAEEMVKAVQLLDNAVLAIVGDGDVVPQLKKEVVDKNLQNKVLFFGKRPYKELLQFTMLSDVGISMDKDTNINYRFSLGNKIFDYIHSSLPVLVSDLPEIAKIVHDYNVGIVCQSHEPPVIAMHLKRMFEDDDLYQKFKNNTKIASKELTWESEKKVLEQIYLPLIDK